MSSFRGTDRFELVRQLGEGGMGIVYEVFDRERELRVALETLRQLDAASPYRFKREFRALTDVSHPNIIALHELVSSGDDWFLTMEHRLGELRADAEGQRLCDEARSWIEGQDVRMWSGCWACSHRR